LYELAQNILATISEKIDELIRAVENGEDTRNSRILLDVSERCDTLVKDYREKLGIEIRLPLRLRVLVFMKSALNSTVKKLFPILILVFIYFLLRNHIPTDILEHLELTTPTACFLLCELSLPALILELLEMRSNRQSFLLVRRSDVLFWL